MGAVALATALTGTFVHAAVLLDVTVSNLTELTNAVAQSVNYDWTYVTVKPGVYDLSTLEEFVVKNDSGAVVWGTNCKADGVGYAHIVFSKNMSFKGENTKHWSQKTREEESIFKGAGENDTMRLFYGYTGGGRKSYWSHLTFENGGSKDWTGGETVTAGGAIYVMGAHLVPPISVTNCVFRNNRGSIGGATYGHSVADSLFENNKACKGGAAYVMFDDDTGGLPWTNRLVNCVFRGNVATGSGGGAVNCNGDAEIMGCLFTNNTSTANYGVGGAIKMEGAVTKIVHDSIFVDNTSGRTGGAVHSSGGLGGFEGCTFLRNSASDGGAAWITEKIKTIEGCTVVSNTVSGKYAAFYLNGFDRVADSTLAFNTAGYAYAGIAVTNFANGGTVENCVFESNTNSPTLNVGSHVCGAKAVRNCTFRGYGDMIAKTYDRCLFDRCAFDYDNWSGGMLLFDTRTGPGHIRNCLFRDGTAHIYIKNGTGDEVEIANCTFVNNLAKTVLNQGSGANTEGFLLYAFRGASDGNGMLRPSTNRVVNCLFWNNSWHGGARQDISTYRTGTSVATPAQNLFYNCLYETASLDVASGSIYRVDLFDTIVAKPRFVAGDARYPDVPYYMIRRSSQARRAGLVLSWMTEETDLAGAAMVSAGGTVDMGAYQCTLPETGLIFTLR